jgi:Reverse transcriptase (RNA-dependent DNA polymerase)
MAQEIENGPGNRGWLPGNRGWPRK